MELELLKKLYEVATKLDYELCTIANGSQGTLGGDEYERLMDIMIEVEEYLEGK